MFETALETQDRSPVAIHFLFSPRARKDGRHRDSARSDRDTADRFPSELTARREGVLAGASGAGKRKSSCPYAGDAPASTPFRCAGLCVDDFETWAADEDGRR